VQRTADISAKLVERFLAAVTPEYLETQRFLYYCSVGTLQDPANTFRSGPIKYAAHYKRHLDEKLPLLPFMSDLAGCKVYELGVGAGHLLFLLREVMGCDVYGCDIHAETHELYRPLREALGVQDVTHDREVRFGQPLGIEPGTEAVVCLGPVFMRRIDDAASVRSAFAEAADWGVEEHEWFVNQCDEGLTGARRMVIRFNRKGLMKNRPVLDYYRRIGTFPIRDDPHFCVIAL
jgi:SAM-dependent methyltransferase